MLKYLILPLATDAVSFCHYEQRPGKSEFITEDTLREALFWAMKENLAVQFIYPRQSVPYTIKALVDTVDHADIVPDDCEDKEVVENANVVVFDGWHTVAGYPYRAGQAYVLRTPFADLTSHTDDLTKMLGHADRVSVVVTDVKSFDETAYREFLDSMVPVVTEQYRTDHAVQFNLLTDRMMLTGMNNCNAGHETLTLAPDGRFYICPAFYAEDGEPVDTLAAGPEIKNPQLYRLDHAPICRTCDAWQCRRCVWLNRQLTREVNTPGREQCVMAHLERNAAAKLLAELRKFDANFMPDTELTPTDCLDPFDKLNH